MEIGSWGNILTGLQLIGTFLAFGLIIFIYRAKSSEPQKVLFAGAVFIYINMLGYYFELTSETLEAALLGIKMEYIGNTLGSLLLIFFICIYSPRRKYRFIKMFYLINNMFILLMVLTVNHHQLFYKNISIQVMKSVTFVKFERGIFYFWWMITSVLLELFVVFVACTAYRIHKNKKQPEYALLVAATIVPVLGWPLNLTIAGGLYDFCPMTMLITTACLAVITNKYRMLDTVTTAKDRLIDELEEGIIVYDSEDILAYYNKEASLIFPELDSLNKIKAKQKIDEFLLKNEGGFHINKHYFQWKRNLLFDEKNRFMGQIIRIIDDTETYEYTSKLIELKNDAEKANRAKSIFLTNMSHEIRTPLNAILGMNELILRESMSEEVKGYAGEIKEASRILLSLIDDILDLSKIESGKLELQPDYYELNSLISNVFSIIFMKAEEKGLLFSIKVNETIPKGLYGDEIRIRQCLLNLLTNSVKYTKKGKISLNVSWTPCEEEQKMFLKFEVTDTGIGIRQGDLDKIFRSFERVDYQKNKGVEGAGLGLNITRELVRQMNGELEVESVYGEGSTFRFTIPQIINNRTQMGSVIYNLPVNTKPYKSPYIFTAPDANILIVDDNAVNISVVKGLLKKCDLQTDKALSGPECLDKVSRNYYDIILMDHMMPGMDGMETLKKIKQMKECKCADSPCIALTANAVSGSREQYMAAGFTDYLSKPIDIDKLYGLLTKYLPKDKVKMHPKKD